MMCTNLISKLKDIESKFIQIVAVDKEQQIV